MSVDNVVGGGGDWTIDAKSNQSHVSCHAELFRTTKADSRHYWCLLHLNRDTISGLVYRGIDGGRGQAEDPGGLLSHLIHAWLINKLNINVSRKILNDTVFNNAFLKLKLLSYSKNQSIKPCFIPIRTIYMEFNY